MDTCPGRELWRRSFDTVENPLTGGSVGSFGISEGNITGRGKKKKPTEYMPNHNRQWRSSTDAHVCHKWVGAGQGSTVCMLRVRTRPECPEDNLRELTWDSNPNCGITRKKKKNWIFLHKALTRSLACSQKKGLNEYQRRAGRLHTGPPHAGGREAGGRQPELEGKGQS